LIHQELGEIYEQTFHAEEITPDTVIRIPVSLFEHADDNEIKGQADENDIEIKIYPLMNEYIELWRLWI